MNEMAELVMEFKGKVMPIKHIPGPEGVRGRNSDNKLIKSVLGWAPSTTLRDGLCKTFKWINKQIEDAVAQGAEKSMFKTSKVYKATMEDIPEALRINNAK